MGTAAMIKQKRSFTLSKFVAQGIESNAKEQKVSRSALVDRILHEYLRRKKEKQIREGYKALRDVSRSIAGASSSLQKRVVPDY